MYIYSFFILRIVFFHLNIGQIFPNLDLASFRLGSVVFIFIHFHIHRNGLSLYFSYLAYDIFPSVSQS